jgi:putative serine protease PepD
VTSDDAEPTVPNPATAEPTAILPTAGAPNGNGPAAGQPLSALTPPAPGAGAMPLRTPGSDAAYRQTNGGRSTSQRSFGRPEPQQETFRPVYQGQAWPTEPPQYRPTYVPPPPADWHQQQARSYASEPQKLNRVVTIAALVALVIGVLAGAGAATAVVALSGNDTPIAQQPQPPVGTGADPKIRTG